MAKTDLTTEELKSPEAIQAAEEALSRCEKGGINLRVLRVEEVIDAAIQAAYRQRDRSGR